MSHASILVIGPETEEEIKKVMYSYQELDLPPENIIKDPRAVFVQELSIDEAQEKFKEWQQTEHPSDENYQSVGEWAKDYEGFYLDVKQTAYGYYQNPNAKWDWYLLGGRWTCILRLKMGKVGMRGKPGLMAEVSSDAQLVDMARKGDIDFDGIDNDTLSKAVNTWQQYVDKIESEVQQGQELEKAEENARFLYAIKKDDTKEQYLAQYNKLRTFAVIKNAKWYEKANMGWWGMTSNEQPNWDDMFDKLLADVSDDTMLSIVDFHI